MANRTLWIQITALGTLLLALIPITIALRLTEPLVGWQIMLIVLVVASPLITLLLTRQAAFAPPASPTTHPDDQNVASMTRQLEVTASELVQAVAAINEVAQAQVNGASEQAEVLEHTSRRLNEFSELSEDVSNRAHTISTISEQTADASESGQEAIQASLNVMEQIRQQVAMIANSIATLASLTRRIELIITSVSEVATQSNLLALNASIEAARAGTHGRGFAVVADEVRALAGQSTQSANEVRTLLREVQGAINETITATQQGMSAVSSGVVRTRQAADAMQHITQEITLSNDANHAIYNSIRQQVDGLEAVAIDMERVRHITQQNLAGMQVVRTVSSNLTRLSFQLQTALNAADASSSSEG